MHICEFKGEYFIAHKTLDFKWKILFTHFRAAFSTIDKTKYAYLCFVINSFYDFIFTRFSFSVLFSSCSRLHYVYRVRIAVLMLLLLFTHTFIKRYYVISLFRTENSLKLQGWEVGCVR